MVFIIKVVGVSVRCFLRFNPMTIESDISTLDETTDICIHVYIYNIIYTYTYSMWYSQDMPILTDIIMMLLWTARRCLLVIKVDYKTHETIWQTIYIYLMIYLNLPLKTVVHQLLNQLGYLQATVLHHRPERLTTQQEHAAAQMSIAVKMGEAFWYATCSRSQHERRQG